jgi:hypothetical protein
MVSVDVTVRTSIKLNRVAVWAYCVLYQVFVMVDVCMIGAGQEGARVNVVVVVVVFIGGQDGTMNTAALGEFMKVPKFDME